MLNILVPCPVLTQDQPIECRAIVTKLGSVIYIFNLHVEALAAYRLNFEKLKGAS